MSAAPPFARQPQAGLPLYLQDPAAAPGLPEGYQAGFWRTAAPPHPPAPLSLAASWGERGVYLFLNATPADPALFAATLGRLLAAGPFARARFLWIANPDAPLEVWDVQGLAADPGGIVGPAAQIVFRNYAVTVGAGAVVTPTPAGDGFAIAAGSGRLTLGVAGGRIWDLAGGGLNLALTGGELGCLVFSLPVGGEAAGTGSDFFAALGAGLRYFVDDDSFPVPGVLQVLRYPLFAGAPPVGALRAVFDPGHPLDVERTYLGFAAPGGAIASYLRTNFGQPATLAPARPAIAPWSPRLVLEEEPNRRPAPPQAPYYWAPVGSFTLGLPAVAEAAAGAYDPPVGRLMCGTAGVEYLGPTTPDALLHFFPGRPAYAPASGSAGDGDLSPLGRTSWVWMTAEGGRVVYFAQPESSALHGATASAYLRFLEVPAGVLTEPEVFPLVPYAGVRAASLAPYERLEARVLQPLRRRLIAAASVPGGPGSPTLPAEPPISVSVKTAGDPTALVTGATPQGLLVELDSSRSLWKTLTLAHQDASDGAPAADLRLRNLHGGLRDALQTQQLFAVIRDAGELLAAADLEYEISAEILHELRRLDPEPVPETVISALAPLVGQVYLAHGPFETALDHALAALAPALTAHWRPVVLAQAARFDLVIEGWRFRLSPTLWGVHPAAPTVMVLKYADRPLRELAADPTTWIWPEAAGDAVATRALLGGILDRAVAEVEAAAAAGRHSDFDAFVHGPVEDAGWNGILFLNADVPLSSLPDEIAGLAAGIDPAKFYAHHLGVELTPVHTEGGLHLGSSSLFGLISYEDPAHLTYTGQPYDFKVLSLKVRFASSAIAAFSSRIELMANAWFGELGDLAGSPINNNLLLDGTFQRTAGKGSYLFVGLGSNRFAMRSLVLDQVEVTRVQFITLLPPAGAPDTSESRSRFLLWGNLRFRALPDFDVFSFGREAPAADGTPGADGFLRFSGLSVDLRFDPRATPTRLFTFNLHDLAFNAGASVARSQSLYAHFPVDVATLFPGAAGDKPEDLGYLPVSTPLTAGTLGPEWYGFTYTLDLGSLGALAGQLGLTVEIVAAWAPDAVTANVQVGLLLPGGRRQGSLIPIQGILKLGFSSLEMTADPSAAGVNYMLKLKRFVLSVLGQTFPPGQVDLFFFGNPSNTDRTSLGWYGAYLKGS